MTPLFRRCRLACSALLAALALGAPAAAQRSGEPPNIFADFRTLQLANGLTVWYRYTPGAPTVSISVAVPAGSDRDPEGREELAHVLEHALFADRDGRTQEELRTAIEERGGAFNASTSPDRTFFWVTAGREHGLFALEWLHGVLAPRSFTEQVAARSREPVALEVGLGPRDLLGWVRDELVLAPALLPPGFWQREFGLDVPEYRRPDRWASLQAIGARDLEGFHRTHYVPSRMVLMIVGDVDSTSLARRLESTFGRLPAWPEPPAAPAGTPRTGTSQRFLWQLRPDAVYDLRFRFATLDSADHLRMLFSERLLERRLMRRLRWGPNPASYGVSTSLLQRGDVGFLQVRTAIQPARLGDARGMIEDELLRLRHGRYPTAEFQDDRAAIVRQVMLEGLSPVTLRAWAAGSFYRVRQHPHMPDLPARFAAIEPAELSAFAARRLGPGQAIRTVARPVPLGQPGLLALGLLAVGAGVALARRLLVRPAPLHALRYVARLRGPLTVRLAGGALLAAALLTAARLGAAAGHRILDPWILSLDSFPIQAAAFLVAITAGTLLTAGALALVPHKLLVFEDELRLKYRAYRSRAWGADELLAAEPARFGDVFLSPRAFRTLPLTFGLRAPGLLITTRTGPDLFVATRDTAELTRVLHETVLARRAGAPSQAALSSSQFSA